MIATRLIREAANDINIHSISYEDLTNAMGEVRVLLARLGIEKDVRLNVESRKAAQLVHDDEQKQRDDFDKHVRETIEGKH